MSDARNDGAVRARAQRGHPRRRELAGARVRLGRAARRSSSPAPRAPTSGTSRARATSTTCSRCGASILGHAHPRSSRRCSSAAADGTSYGAPTEREVVLAEAICERVPSVREGAPGVVSGTEATMTAVRLARGATGRRQDREVRRLLPRPRRRAAGRRRAAAWPPSACPARPACTDGGRGRHRRRALQRRCPTLDDDVAVRHRRAGRRQHGPRRARRRASSRACAPRATAVGALLIFDEVITGFRARPRRRAGAATASRPTSPCFGKVIGGGLPVGAFGGRADVMDDARAARPRVPGGHAVGEPARHRGRASPCSTLLDDGAYTMLAGRAAQLAACSTDAFGEAGLPVQVPRVGPLVGLFFAATAGRLRRRRSRPTRSCYAAFFHAHARSRRRRSPPAPTRSLFPGLAHDQGRARARRRPGRRSRRGKWRSTA